MISTMQVPWITFGRPQTSYIDDHRGSRFILASFALNGLNFKPSSKLPVNGHDDTSTTNTKKRRSSIIIPNDHYDQIIGLRAVFLPSPSKPGFIGGVDDPTDVSNKLVIDRRSMNNIWPKVVIFGIGYAPMPSQYILYIFNKAASLQLCYVPSSLASNYQHARNYKSNVVVATSSSGFSSNSIVSDDADHHHSDARYCLSYCHHCKMALGPKNDIFIYRGDMAFCSEGCRQIKLFEDGIVIPMEDDHFAY